MTTANPQGAAGRFATSRRGGLTQLEIVEIKRLRSGERPVSWQNLSRQFGRSVHDLMVAAGEIASPEPQVVQPTPPPVAVARPKKLTRDEVLTRLWMGSYTVADIATALGMTKAGVKARRRLLGLPPRIPGTSVIWSAAE